MKTPLLFLNVVFIVWILVHSVNRDIKLESHYPSDLRNRVVGARLEKDGILPYDYLWNPKDGERYFDPANRHTASAPGNITASPFFHQLMIPLSELPQRNISRIWLLLQYLFLIAMIFLTCCLTKNNRLRWAIINTGILFTLTEAWKVLISAGQLYLFEAILMTLIMYFLLSKKKFTLVLAGILAVVFVLTRPIAIVLFIPFLFNYKNHLIFMGSAAVSFLFYGLFVLTSPYQKDLYRNYTENMKLQVIAHQRGDMMELSPGTNILNPFPVMEGFDFQKTTELEAKDQIMLYSENGNFYILYENIFHSKMPVYVLNIVCATTVFLISFIFFFRNLRERADDLQIILLGLTLYMIVEMFSPIHRHQYNTVQWFPLVLAGILLYRNRFTTGFILLLAGLLLNISNTHWIPMRHMAGEMCWISGLLILVFSPVEKLPVWKPQS
jgi:hypothetical protein